MQNYYYYFKYNKTNKRTFSIFKNEIKLNYNKSILNNYESSKIIKIFLKEK